MIKQLLVPPPSDMPPETSCSLRDELQLADHVAFLAHSQEGVEAISGACVEEGQAGLIVRLASNHTPCPATVSGLQRLLCSVGGGATQGKP